MSRFNPISTLLHPDVRTDAFGEGVVWSLTRPLDVVPPWSPRRSLIGGAGTVGILPALAWPRGWNDFVTMEREQFEAMIHWFDQHSGRGEKVRTRAFPWNRPRRTGKKNRAWLLSLAVVAAVSALLIFHWWVSAAIVWNVALSVLFYHLAMSIHFTHRADTRWVVRQVHQVARSEKIAVHLLEPGGQLVLGRHWFVVGLMMSLLAQPWGMTYALTGALRRRAIREDGPAIRLALAVACRQLFCHWNPRAQAPGPGRLETWGNVPKIMTDEATSSASLQSLS